MDALTYTNWQNTFATKASRMNDDELQWALKDINATLATCGSNGCVNSVSGMTDYQQKLWLEKDEMLGEMGRRVAAEMKRKGITI
jgi:hypothetical protein